ncbi:MAG: glycerol acyltransferase, partial [Bacteroidales bacterium]|nr:glycerol acyltransferase [Bacteroidales bacterium]
KTFISKAKQYGHDILPIYFEGKNSNFFYNLSQLRTALHIKANIEQIFLPDEFFKQRNSEFNVIVSHVIKNEELLADSRSDFAIAQSIKQTIYQLPKELNAQR